MHTWTFWMDTQGFSTCHTTPHHNTRDNTQHNNNNKTTTTTTLFSVAQNQGQCGLCWAFSDSQAVVCSWYSPCGYRVHLSRVARRLLARTFFVVGVMRWSVPSRIKSPCRSTWWRYLGCPRGGQYAGSVRVVLVLFFPGVEIAVCPVKQHVPRISSWRQLDCHPGGQCRQESGSCRSCRAFTVIPDGVELVLTSGGFRAELAAQQFSSCSPSTGTYGCNG